MLITRTSVNTQLGLIPPNYDQYLIMFWENQNLYYDFGEESMSIAVYEPFEWANREYLKESSRMYASTYQLNDWRLVKGTNNAPNHLFVPKGMKLIIDAVYLCKEKYFVRKPIKFEGNDFAVSVHDLIQYHNFGKEYFFLGYELKSPVTASVTRSFASNDDNF